MYATNIWKEIAPGKREAIFDYNEGYKAFLSVGKTERRCVAESIKLAEAKGFRPVSEFTRLKAGDKVYFVNRGKNIALYVMGTKPVC